MLRALQTITKIDDTPSYVHHVHRVFQNLSTKAADEVSKTLQVPVKICLIFRTTEAASPNQVCANQMELRETGRLEMARFIFASHAARFFSEAVTTLLMSPLEELMDYPMINQLFTPGDMLRMPPENVQLDQLLSPS